MPVTGDAPDRRQCLESLLTNTYTDSEAIFVTRDEQDPAVAVTQELTAQYAHIRHVVSGPARRCGQKNHNLLAGIAAAGPDIALPWLASRFENQEGNVSGYSGST